LGYTAASLSYAQDDDLVGEAGFVGTGWSTFSYLASLPRLGASR